MDWEYIGTWEKDLKKNPGWIMPFMGMWAVFHLVFLYVGYLILVLMQKLHGGYLGIGALGIVLTLDLILLWMIRAYTLARKSHQLSSSGRHFSEHVLLPILWDVWWQSIIFAVLLLIGALCLAAVVSIAQVWPSRLRRT